MLYLDYANCRLMTEYESYVQEMPDIQMQLNAPNAPLMRGYDSTNLKCSQIYSNKSCLGMCAPNQSSSDKFKRSSSVWTND